MRRAARWSRVSAPSANKHPCRIEATYRTEFRWPKVALLEHRSAPSLPHRRVGLHNEGRLVRRIEVAAWLAAASLVCGRASAQDDNPANGSAERDPEPPAAASEELANPNYFGEFTA